MRTGGVVSVPMPRMAGDSQIAFISADSVQNAAGCL